MKRNHLSQSVAIVALLLATPQVHAAAKAVPPNRVDSVIAEQIAKEFAGDRSRYLRWLRDQNKTQREYRAEVAAKIAEQATREEAPKGKVERK
jgi:hypothetical protein